MGSIPRRGAVNFQCGLLMLLCAVLRGTSMRPQNSGTVEPLGVAGDPLENVDPEIVENPATPKLPFFEVDVTLKDEEAVLKKYEGAVTGALVYNSLPKEASLDNAASQLIKDLQDRLVKEANITSTLQKEGTEGQVIKLIMGIQSYQLEQVLPKEIAQDLNTSMSALPAAVAAVKVQDVYDDVLTKVSDFLEAKWMKRIPSLLEQTLSNEKVEATVLVVPKAATKPSNTSNSSNSSSVPVVEVVLRVEMEKRLPLAQSADPQVSTETVEAMTQQKYLALVQPKIQEHVARGIRDFLGGAFPFTAKAECDSDFGSLSKHSFWLPINISDFDEVKGLKALNKSLADDAQKLLGLLDKLSICGVPDMAEAASKIRGALRAGMLEKLLKGFTEHVGSLLGAEVQAVNGSTFRWFQQQAPYGVCCRSKTASSKSKTDEVFWIAAEVTEGGNDTHNGICPIVQETQNPPCASRKKSAEKVVLHHRPYTECFNLAELKDSDKVPERTAPFVSSKC